MLQCEEEWFMPLGLAAFHQSMRRLSLSYQALGAVGRGWVHRSAASTKVGRTVKIGRL
jgi:hypothetical protein